MILVDFNNLENHINTYDFWLMTNGVTISMQSIWELARPSEQLPDFEKIFKMIVLARVETILTTQYDIESLEVSKDGIFTANNVVLEKLSDFKKLSKKFVQEGETV